LIAPDLAEIDDDGRIQQAVHPIRSAAGRRVLIDHGVKIRSQS
jgi:hypothetical protein